MQVKYLQKVTESHYLFLKFWYFQCVHVNLLLLLCANILFVFALFFQGAFEYRKSIKKELNFIVSFLNSSIFQKIFKLIESDFISLINVNDTEGAEKSELFIFHYQLFNCSIPSGILFNKRLKCKYKLNFFRLEKRHFARKTWPR